MKHLQNEQLTAALSWRYAVKRFDPTKKISEKDWITLEDSLVLTPSSYGLQPWRFYVVQDPEIRKSLRKAAWGQSQVEEASHFVVFTAKNEVSRDDVDGYLNRIAAIREIPMEKLSVFRKFMEEDLFSGQRSQMIREWTARQTYIALGNLMTCAALLGVDTCPMEGFEPAPFDDILKLQGTGYRSTVCCALGYCSGEDQHQTARKVRFDKAEVIHRVG